MSGKGSRAVVVFFQACFVVLVVAFHALEVALVTEFVAFFIEPATSGIFQSGTQDLGAFSCTPAGSVVVVEENNPPQDHPLVSANTTWLEQNRKKTTQTMVRFLIARLRQLLSPHRTRQQHENGKRANQQSVEPTSVCRQIRLRFGSLSPGLIAKNMIACPAEYRKCKRPRVRAEKLQSLRKSLSGNRRPDQPSSASILAASMKSLMLKPPIAWVVSTTFRCR